MFVYEYASGALNYTNKEKDSELPPIKETKNKLYNPKNIRHYSSSTILNNTKDKVKYPNNSKLSLLNEERSGFKNIKWLVPGFRNIK